MPGTTSPARLAFAAQLQEIMRRLRGVETQQQFVFTDPTGVSGDPSNGHAVVVIGNLAPITAIHAFGIASYKTGAWVQI